MFNIPLARLLTAAAIAGIIGVSGYLLGSDVITEEPVSVHLEPTHGTLAIGETFSVRIMIESHIPVNVFKGLLTFDPTKLTVTNIDYNTSIANLWAEEPWYSNGAGTVNFTGGTTLSGGFTGEGSLITITFTAKQAGDAHVLMSEMRVLKHDGLGTDVPLPTPIDALFAVAPETLHEQTLLASPLPGPTITVMPEAPSTDLNHDGKQTIADVSIFMVDFITKNRRSDFNQDGSVDLKDLSILTKR
jgi:Cohesin domain